MGGQKRRVVVVGGGFGAVYCAKHLSERLRRYRNWEVVLLQAANIPTTFGAEMIFKERGIPVIPDILANAGGVIVSYFEWSQNYQRFRWEEKRVELELERVLAEAWSDILRERKARKCSYREAAYTIAVD